MTLNPLYSYQRYFRDVWPILSDMSRRGVPISEDDRMQLKALIIKERERVTAEIQAIVPKEVRSNKQKSGLKRAPQLECDCGWKGRTDHECSLRNGDDDSVHNPDDGNVDSEPLHLVRYVDLAHQNGLIEIEVGIEKEEKCQCLKKDRAACPVCLGDGIVPAGTVVKRWAEPKDFNPNSPPQVKRLIRFLGHPVPKHEKRTTADGEAADTTEMKELERLFARTKHPVYPLLIQERMLTKTDGTYCEGWKPSAVDSSVHTTFTFQTATWQTSSRAPNVQNGLKHGKTAFQKELAYSFNSMQRAFPGRVLINLDFKSFHALTTAVDANSRSLDRIARIDMHSFFTVNAMRLPEASGLFERPDDEMRDLFKFLKKNEEFKFFRDFKAKRIALGIENGQGYRSIYHRFKEELDSETEAKNLHHLFHVVFPDIKPYQELQKKIAADEGKIVSMFGAVRHFYDVTRFDRKQQKWVSGDQAEQAVCFRLQNHANGMMREALLRIRAVGADERFGLCNQIHDSLLFHCPLELADECAQTVKPLMEAPSEVLIYPGMAPNGLVVGVEVSMGPSLAEMKEKV